jgi:hypothetical protein
MKNHHLPRSVMTHIIDLSEIQKLPCICHLKVTSKYTCCLLSNFLFLIVILFMSFHLPGVLCHFKSDGMKPNTSGERHVLMKYSHECHHPADIY